MKKLVSIVIFVSMLLCVPTFAESVSVTIDDKAVAYNSNTGAPFIREGRTLVPLRATMEAFGAEVSWNQAEETAIVKYNTITVKCKKDESRIYRNGVKIENDAAACIENGRTYLPIRAVLEAFGAEVSWNNGVVVTSDYGRFVKATEGGGKNNPYIWNDWNSAIASLNAGNYSAALSGFISLAPDFVAQGDIRSSAMLYLHMGTCYSKLGSFDKAALCYKRESEYWNTAGLIEETTDASRRSKLITTGIKVYAQTSDKDMFRLSPQLTENGGILLGAYAEGDSNIYNPYSPDRFYMDTFPQMVGKDMGGYLLYLPYGTDIGHYETHIRKAKEKGKLIQIALEPHDGVAVVNGTDGYLERLAKDMEASGVEFLLRFAGEMNDTTCAWYTADTALYIEKFRTVASIFHQYAPSVKVVWSPNFYPEYNLESYYPGDEYVDYVGLSAYKLRQTETDPLKEGVDRSRYSNIMNFICATYGDRKPIIIAEGGASYMDYDTWGDITDFAVSQMKEFYAYLPIMYPSVKMAFYFDSDRERWKFMLSKNQAVLDAYKAGIAADVYKSDTKDYPFSAWYEVADNVALKAEAIKLSAYLDYPYQEKIAYAVYYINDVQAGVAYGAPYEVAMNLAGYAGQTVKLTVKAFSTDSLLMTEDMNVVVR